MTLRKVMCACVLAMCVAPSAIAQGLPKASRPEEVGFSSQRLERLADVFRGDVDRGASPLSDLGHYYGVSAISGTARPCYVLAAVAP